MSSLLQLRAKVWDYLGTKSTDPAYLPATLTSYLNDALNGIYADVLQLNPDSFSTTTTLTAVSASSHEYVFSAQATAITTFAGVLECRVTDVDGVELREAPFSDRNKVSGNFYSITGPDASPTLWTNAGVAAGTALFLNYRVWPGALALDSESPSWIPAAFHDVPALRAAKMAFAQGGESRFPTDLRELLEDREAQFTFHIGRRSRSPKLRRDV